MKEIPYIRGHKDQVVRTSKPVKGYKGFYAEGDENFVCLDKIYKCPGVEYMNCKPALCEAGMHFCQDIRDVLRHYPPREDTVLHIAEVVAIGDTEIGYDKCVTNKLVLIREVDICEELNKYNLGEANVGATNIGNKNIGGKNIGDGNKGGGNIGSYNIGHFNYGDSNKGYRNDGYANIGDFNIGDYNNGSNNIGSYNVGSFTIGEFNNAFDGCIGAFNTESTKITLFNKPCDLTIRDWCHLPARELLLEMPFLDSNPTLENTPKSIARQSWWDALDKYDKSKILNLPNFDPQLFHKITGIDVVPIMNDEGQMEPTNIGEEERI